MEDKKLLQLVSEIGFDMLSYGGDIYRVEETVKRICFAYGMDGVDVFAIPTTIIVSITRQDETYSRTRRLASKGTDLDKVDRLNNLSRRLCREKPDYDLAKEWLRQIRSGLEYPLWMLCCAHGAAALIFALFFGGSWKDGLWAFPIGIMIKLVSYGLGKLNANSFFVTVICGALSALMAGLGAQLHVLDQVSHVLMGAIMNLVPGLMLTNAMRDIMAGDFIAGLMRVAEAVLIGAGIAVGVMVPLSFFQSLLGKSSVRGDFLPCLYAGTWPQCRCDFAAGDPVADRRRRALPACGGKAVRMVGQYAPPRRQHEQRHEQQLERHHGILRKRLGGNAALVRGQAARCRPRCMDSPLCRDGGVSLPKY